MKTVLLSLLLSLSLYGVDNLAKYDISMKMLGEIGKSSLTIRSTDQTYVIKMHLQMDKSLSDVEHSYESYGTLEDGVYLPERFIKYIREEGREETNYYIFDHEKHQIKKYTTIVEEKSGLLSMFSSKEKETTEHFELITDYSPNDTLTTFLNAERLLGDKNKMAVKSVGFRKDERNIELYRDKDAYRLSIVDKDADDDYSILVSIAPDGLVREIVIQEYTILGSISVAREDSQ